MVRRKNTYNWLTCSRQPSICYQCNSLGFHFFCLADVSSFGPHMWSLANWTSRVYSSTFLIQHSADISFLIKIHCSNIVWGFRNDRENTDGVPLNNPIAVSHVVHVFETFELRSHTVRQAKPYNLRIARQYFLEIKFRHDGYSTERPILYSALSHFDHWVYLLFQRGCIGKRLVSNYITSSYIYLCILH